SRFRMCSGPEFVCDANATSNKAPYQPLAVGLQHRLLPRPAVVRKAPSQCRPFVRAKILLAVREEAQRNLGSRWLNCATSIPTASLRLAANAARSPLWLRIAEPYRLRRYGQIPAKFWRQTTNDELSSMVPGVLCVRVRRQTEAGIGIGGAKPPDPDVDSVRVALDSHRLSTWRRLGHSGAR